jgi:hypothetical protein
MRWLVAMECSGRVRDALRAKGHDAWSCDVKPCESDPRWHIQADVFTHKVVHAGWDGMIAHPACTFLTRAGARHMNIPWRCEAQLASLHTVLALWSFPIQHIAIENPPGRLSTLWRLPDQIIQPHMFGHREFKSTCFWLKALPLLTPTNILKVPDKGTREHILWNRVHREGPSPGDSPYTDTFERIGERAARRSRTLEGIAEAIADQWGDPSILRLVG